MTSFRLSSESLNLFRDNLDQYQEEFNLIKPVSGQFKQTHLKVKIADGETKTTRRVNPNNGDVEVEFVYPLDNNNSIEDGRIYLVDTFVFNSSEETLKDFQRDFKYNHKGDSSQWREWLSQYAQVPESDQEAKEDKYPAKEKPSLVNATPFAMEIGRSYVREFSRETLLAMKKRHPSYLNEMVQAAHSQIEDLKFKLSDSGSHYTVRYAKDNTIEVTLTLVFDNDDNASNGRLLAKDKFVLDGKSHQMMEYHRSWESASDDNEVFRVAAEQLAQAEISDKTGKAEVIEDLSHSLLPMTREELAKTTDNLSTGKKQVFEGRVAAEKAKQAEIAKQRVTSQIEGLTILQFVGKEILARRYDESQGWIDKGIRLLTKKPGINLEKDTALWDSIHDKLLAHVKEQPEAETNLFTIIDSLELTTDEKALKDILFEDVTFQQLNSILEEPSDQLRYENLENFAKQDLLKREELETGAAAIALFLQDKGSERIKKDASPIVAYVEGTASAAVKLDYMLPKFGKQLLAPSVLAGMVGAGVFGAAAEATLLRFLGRGTGIMGGAGRLFASGAAIPIESLAFKGIENAVASAKMDTKKVWDGFKADTLAMSALFFSMRLTHGAVGKIAAKIGTGKWLPGLSRPLQTKMFMTQPTGRIILPIATRELNGAGKAFLGLMNHGGGVAAMYGAGLFNRQVDLQEESKQGELGNIFDTLITYPQAMVGFKIADGLTSGKLHSFLGNFRGRIEDLKREIKDTKSILKPVPVAKNPLLAATLASPVDSPIDSSSRATAPSPQPQAASSTSAAKPESVEANLEDIEIEVDDAAFNVRSAVHSAAFSPVQFHLDLSGNHMVIDSGRDLQMIWIGRYPSEKTVRAIRMHANATVHVGMDETVSNYHAIVARDSAGAWWIGDQGSAYGTTLNNQRVLPGKPIPLESVNHIRLGPSLTFLLEIQGDLVPVDTTVKPPNIPIPSQQFDKVKPPAPAEKFPFEVVFPGDITPKGTVEVAYLVSLDGKEKEPFKSNRSNWGFSYENKPVGLIYIDETGKWVALNQAEENGIKVNNKVVNGFVFLENNDVLNFGSQDWIFRAHEEIPTEVKMIERGEDPFPLVSKTLKGDDRSEITRVLPTGELLSLLDEKQGRKGKEGDTTATMPALISPMLIDQFTSEEMAGLPPGQGPARLRIKLGDREDVRTGPNDRSFMIGDFSMDSDPLSRVMPGAHQEKAKVDAQIFFGEWNGQRSWWLHPLMGDLYHRGRPLMPNGTVQLQFGEVISFGAPEGHGERYKIVFEKTPKSGAEFSKNEGDEDRPTYYPLHPLPIPPEAFPSHPVSAAKPYSFPHGVILELTPQQAGMELQKINSANLSDESHNPVINAINFEREIAQRGGRAFLLSWNGSLRTPPGAQFLGHEIDSTHDGVVKDPKGKEIGRYIRIVDGGKSGLERKMLIYTNGPVIADNLPLALTRVSPVPPPRRSSSPPPLPPRVRATPADAPSAKRKLSPPPLPHEARPSDKGKKPSPPPLPSLPVAKPSPLPPPPQPPPLPPGKGPQGPVTARARPVSKPQPPSLPGARPAKPLPPPERRVSSSPPAPSRGRGPLPTLTRDLLTLREPFEPSNPPLPLVSPDPGQRPRSPLPPPPPGTPGRAPLSPPPPRPPSPVPQARSTSDAPFFSGHRPKAPSLPPSFRSAIRSDSRPRISPVPSPTGSPVEGGSPPPSRMTPTEGRPAAPSIQSSVFAASLQPFMVVDVVKFTAAMDGLERFPQLEDPKKVGQTRISQPGFLAFLQGFREKPYFEKLSRAYEQAHFNFSPEFTVANDKQFLKFSNLVSKQASHPNTVAALTLNPNMEGEMFETIFQKILLQDIPLEVVVPIQLEEGKPSYLGIFYHSNDYEFVHKLLRDLAQAYSSILGDKLMPFSEPLLDATRQKIVPGVGVMEYSLHLKGAELIDPLMHRRNIIEKAWNDMNTALQGRALTPEHMVGFLQRVVRLLTQMGYDTRHVGFNRESLQGDHSLLVEELYPKIPD